MAETSGSGVPSTKTLSHREAVLPFLLAGSRWERVSATTVCINSTFDRIDKCDNKLQKMSSWIKPKFLIFSIAFAEIYAKMRERAWVSAFLF